MIEFTKLYHFTTRPLMRILRLVLFVILYGIILFEILHHHYPRFSLFFFSLFLMLETFFRYRIIKHTPKITVKENSGKNILDSFTLQVLDILLFQPTTTAVIQKLLTKKQTQFFLDKAGLVTIDISILEIPVEELENYVYQLVKNCGGDYVTTIDIFAAYLLITEPKTKLLFTKELREEEFMQILLWVRNAFSSEEHPETKPVVFEGEGIAEEWNTGWTYETKKYILDFTTEVLRENPLFMWQTKEYEMLVEVLTSTVKNSAIIIGEPGVGKTSLVAAIAINSFAGKLEGSLYHQKFYELLVGELIAGATTAGDLHGRIEPLMAELSHAGNIILFIPEMENLVGSSTFKTDLSGAFFPFLKNGNIRIVGTITSGAYKEFIEPKASFMEVFEPIHIPEPDRQRMIAILLDKAPEIERKNKISLTYKALIAAIDYAKRFLPEHALPGSAISLLSYVASHSIYAKKRLVNEKDVLEAIEEKTHIAIAAPQGKEKDLLLHLEDTLHERVIGQDDAIHAISEALRRIRSGMTSGIRPISFLFLGPTGVGKTETARALASLYFGGEEHMIRLDMSEYTGADSINRLLGSAPGQGNERGELTEKVREHPFSLVLLDEFEKAHQDILNLFLQVLEDGRLTDNKGKTISFVNTIIIATSNAGSEFIREAISKGHPDMKKFQQNLLELLQSKGIFKPELLNRFDDIIAFSPLGDSQIYAVVQLLLKNVSQELEKKEITVTFDQSVVEKIVKEGYDQQFGARPLRRYIQNNIEDLLAQELLKDEIKRGEKITVAVDEEGNIVINK